MDLKDYIKSTITAISEAIIESGEALKDKGVIVNPEKVEIGKNGEKLLRADGWRYVQNLDFEILVSAEEMAGSEGGGGLKVAGIFKVEGGLNESASSQQVNKIKFSLPVALPCTTTPDTYKSKKYTVS
ncbi:MAG: hypothetical protein KDD36_15095 [Flavobacteriales bacterium]|nr:hypothetical protein [Flavobacteriales bacterium]